MIVYLLRELTIRHKDIWVRVVDSDGEFLLVEAAGTLPAWLEPEVADNRVSFLFVKTSINPRRAYQLIQYRSGLDTSRTAPHYQAKTREGAKNH